MTDVTTTFTLDRRAVDLVFRRAELVYRERLTPAYVRVRVRGDDLRGFGGTSGADDHVRLFFPDRVPAPVSAEELRSSPSREWTPVAWADDWLDLEFALHGREGVAGRWADTAPLGSVIGVGGPRGTLHLDGTPDGWLLAGDETAVPQIRRYAARIPEGAPALILVEVSDEAHRIPVDWTSKTVFLHRRDASPGSVLTSALDSLTARDRPSGDVFGFIAAEQGVVRPGRALLVDRWGLDPDRVAVKGYWRAGEGGTMH